MSRRTCQHIFLLKNKQSERICSQLSLLAPCLALFQWKNFHKAAFSSEFSCRAKQFFPNNVSVSSRLSTRQQFSSRQLFRDNRFFLCNCETFLLQCAWNLNISFQRQRNRSSPKSLKRKFLCGNSDGEIRKRPLTSNRKVCTKFCRRYRSL